MQSVELVILERIARNMPVRRIEMGSVETKIGPVYIAWGEKDGVIHGVWGCHGLAQTMEFKKGSDEDHAKVALIATALQFTRDCRNAGLFEDPEHFGA